MATTLTAPQSWLLARLPECFSLFEDPAKNCPPTEVRKDSTSGETVYTFGRGDAKAFDSLVHKGYVVHVGCNVYVARK